MRMFKNTNKIILVLALFLICEPLLRLLSFKASTGMNWELLWDNIVENGNVSFYRFSEFWILTPLAGIFLLTVTRISFFAYALLTTHKFYSLVTYEAYEWPYFSETPHLGAILIISINILFVLILFWPLVKKYLLSYYLKDIWDARGRYECNYGASLFINGQRESYRGYIKNISTGGVLFNLYDGAGDKLRVNDQGLIVIEVDQKEYISLEIRLVNTSISEHCDYFGMEFTNLDPRMSLVIMNIVMDLRSKKMAKEKPKRILETS